MLSSQLRCCTQGNGSCVQHVSTAWQPIVCICLQPTHWVGAAAARGVQLHPLLLLPAACTRTAHRSSLSLSERLPLPRLALLPPLNTGAREQLGFSAPPITSLGHWVAGNVVDCVLHRENLVCVGVGDLHRKLLLKGHDQLHHVQAVEAQVLFKVRTRHNLVVVSTTGQARGGVCGGNREEERWR